MGFSFKELIIGPINFKMVEIRHFKDREIAISWRKIIRFWWIKCRFGTRWQTC